MAGRTMDYSSSSNSSLETLAYEIDNPKILNVEGGVDGLLRMSFEDLNSKHEVTHEEYEVVDLKAELFKKREEFERTRQSTSNLNHTDIALSSSNDTIKDLKKLSDANKKRLQDEHEQRYGIRNNKNRKNDKRKKTAQKNDPEKELDAALEASWVALQRKAEEYDRLKRDAPLDSDDEEDDEAIKRRKKMGEDKLPLVDFVKKHLDKKEDPSGNDSEEDEDDDPWVEATDAFGRTRIVRKSEAAKLKQEASGAPAFVASGTQSSSDYSGGPQLISSDMSREEERQRWERQAMSEITGAKDPLAPPTHFDSQREVRNL
ncbi:UNVERIFIED_CONTAM: hypothetical protein HDU68_004649, partial [Siphonaria sp. JEL0065]